MTTFAVLGPGGFGGVGMALDVVAVATFAGWAVLAAAIGVALYELRTRIAGMSPADDEAGELVATHAVADSAGYDAPRAEAA